MHHFYNFGLFQKFAVENWVWVWLNKNTMNVCIVNILLFLNFSKIILLRNNNHSTYLTLDKCTTVIHTYTAPKTAKVTNMSITPNFSWLARWHHPLWLVVEWRMKSSFSFLAVFPFSTKWVQSSGHASSAVWEEKKRQIKHIVGQILFLLIDHRTRSLWALIKG